jgi:hypothetical protein
VDKLVDKGGVKAMKINKMLVFSFILSVFGPVMRRHTPGDIQSDSKNLPNGLARNWPT